ncbi:RraA family protein [Conexibacter woesei]|uniref:Putative 4-hydroxy-4-methyl-2-oxoglutarate aldolase n=1 Tax=Conexibacter woesei (strain DSM 14684 / CCUG 47730 / CIP 108061 / JCM 11494 / NBRC 100937 / ID131577) TaxID=469383 RepID=D3F7W8_CONWI|nr:dimethylmenaquinone methyltransferase [Conexibacter woesei]ADB52862.1 Dimethylmenaquinone methyltransferase [Conexibacter woesei DSM 14684]
MTELPIDPATAHVPASRPDGRDLDLVARLGNLFTAVISDCLDAVGVRENTMARRIRPLHPASTLAGYAATVELVRVDGAPANPDDYYKGELDALDAMQPGDVMVVSTCDGSYWGELLATACRARGVHGLVADAYTRDTPRLVEMDFPTFAAGIDPQDSLGRTDVRGFGGTVSCGGVTVAQGDLVIADNDGVAVIPAALAVEVIERAEAKVGSEGTMRADLAGGMPIGEAFRLHGVL